MTSEQLEPFLNWVKKRYKSLIWTSIFLKNFFLRKKLKVKDASLGEILLIKGSPINICWEVSGCHKVAIEKVGVFPGNLKGITYTCAELPKEIKITFYGFNKKAIVLIDVPQAYLIELKKRFNSGVELPFIKCTAFGLTDQIIDKDKVYFNYGRFKVEVPPVNLIIGNTLLTNTLPEVELKIPEFRQQEFSNN